MKVTVDLAVQVFNWLDIQYISDEDFFQLPTICHNGDSHKLYFYKNTCKLVCFTNCGTMNIFEFISKVKGISKANAFKIVLNNFDTEANDIQSIEYNPIKKFERATHNASHPPIPIDDKVLNTYYPYRIDKWKNEGISFKTQSKFEIAFSIIDNAIIIPHRDLNGNLVGVRQRNLNQQAIDLGIKYVPTKYKGETLKYPTSENLYGYFYNKNEIKKTKKIILFEAEKSVMMMDTFYPNGNFSVALSGHNLSQSQIRFINTLPVNEIIIALDKDFKPDDIETMKALQELIIKKYSKLTARFNVSVIWDNHNLLDYKDSPTDKGKEIFDELFSERRYLS